VSSFPTTAPNLDDTTYNNATPLEDVHPALHNSENAEIDAMVAKVGTGSGNQSPTLNKLLIGTGSGTSDWSKSVPTGDIVGTSDIQTLTNKTLTAPKINSVTTMTSSSEELNTLDGFTGTYADLNYAKDLNATGVTTAEYDFLDGINDAWPVFAPNWTNITVGSGTNTGAYKRLGKTIVGYAKFVFGVGSAVSGSVSLAVPVTPAAALSGTSYPIGRCIFEDAGTGYFFGSMIASGTVYVAGASGTYSNAVALSSTIPMTWASGDKLWVNFMYETT